jgi:endonuclease YncB( thermonuclease family)
MLAGGLAGVAAVPVAEAARRPCTPETGAPMCTVWSAKVAFIADGDTIDVRIGGRGRPRRVRITGIQAMELRRYSSDRRRRRGECHGVAAANRLEQLLRRGRGRVRLAAQDRTSRSGRRLRRAVSTRIDGRWVDVGRALVADGHALWLPNGQEWAWNRSYSDLAERAAYQEIGVWDTASCGMGPSEDIPLRLWVNWDADGNDFQNVNGEWAKIKNLDHARDVDLSGWWFRDSGLRRYRFPAGTRIPARGTITLHMGRGIAGGSRFYWGLSTPPFENAGDDQRAIGDGGYLFDPHGDLRAWMVYPCRTRCARDVGGGVELSAQPRSPESVSVCNAGDSRVDL